MLKVSESQTEILQCTTNVDFLLESKVVSAGEAIDNARPSLSEKDVVADRVLVILLY